MRLALILAILIYSAACFSPDKFTINLDTPASQRYTHLAEVKAASIHKFLTYLHTVPKYVDSFRLAKDLGPILLKKLVGEEFYEECRSVSVGAKIPISDIVVLNYMYELGAYHNFCTSITVQQPQSGQYFLARNLDYGYQEYLIENSVQFTFVKDGQKIVESIGHAGFIGIHSGIRFGQYSVTLNQRIDGGLHLTLK